MNKVGVKMNDVDISWYIKEQTEEESEYTLYTEYYAGSCSSNKDLYIDIRVWNNRWGNEDVKDAKNTKLIISFAYAEDSVLLELCEIKIGNGIFKKIDNTEFNRGIINLETIYGNKNNGDKKNTDNYKDIFIKFTNIPENLQDGLKTMFLDIQYDDN